MAQMVLSSTPLENLCAVPRSSIDHKSRQPLASHHDPLKTGFRGEGLASLSHREVLSIDIILVKGVASHDYNEPKLGWPTKTVSLAGAARGSRGNGHVCALAWCRTNQVHFAHCVHQIDDHLARVLIGHHEASAPMLQVMSMTGCCGRLWKGCGFMRQH